MELQTLKLLKGTKTKFDELESLEENAEYLVDMEFQGNKLLGTDSDGGITEVDVNPIAGVQVNGTDLTPDANNKVNVPLTKGYGAANAGLLALRGNGADLCGITLGSQKDINIAAATDAQVKAKTQAYRPIVPANIDLAVKTGVTTNTITLTDTEKTNAKAWLGIESTKPTYTDERIEF